jgi:dynein light chain LC8-type
MVERTVNFVLTLPAGKSQSNFIRPLGNCQFEAIAYQLYENQNLHEQVRLNICDTIKEHQQCFEGRVNSAGHESYQSIEEYLIDKRKTASGIRLEGSKLWGDDNTLEAAAILYKRDIVVFCRQENQLVKHVFHPLNANVENIPVMLYYTRNHYEAVVDVAEPSPQVVDDCQLDKEKKTRKGIKPPVDNFHLTYTLFTGEGTRENPFVNTTPNQSCGNSQRKYSDLAKAFEWFEESATQGDCYAQYYLGRCYRDGDGVPKDLTKAFEWFEKSATQGDSDVQCNLGLFLHKPPLNVFLKNADMSEEMQQDAFDCATQAMEKFNSESDIARFVKQKFDKKYSLSWHCIVGRNFGSYVTTRIRYLFLLSAAFYLFLPWPNCYPTLQDKSFLDILVCLRISPLD